MAVALLLPVAAMACTAAPPPTSPPQTPTPIPVTTTTPLEATASPEATATPAATPEPEGELFVSERYGYSLQLPDEGWFVVERAGEWRPGTTFTSDASGVDRVYGPLQRYRHDVFLNSQPLAADTSFEEWLKAYDELQQTGFSNCSFDDKHETTTIDGVEARINTAVCNGDRWAEAIWESNGRVYVIRVGENQQSDEPIDPREEIETWLDSITLHRVAP